MSAPVQLPRELRLEIRTYPSSPLPVLRFRWDGACERHRRKVGTTGGGCNDEPWGQRGGMERREVEGLWRRKSSLYTSHARSRDYNVLDFLLATQRQLHRPRLSMAHQRNKSRSKYAIDIQSMGIRRECPASQVTSFKGLVL